MQLLYVVIVILFAAIKHVIEHVLVVIIGSKHTNMHVLEAEIDYSDKKIS